MGQVLQFRRRETGVAGAPTTLKCAEPSYNMVDDIVYIGKGNNGSGVATSIVPIGGSGAFVDKSSAQSIAGTKTFSSPPKCGTAPAASDDLVNKAYADSLQGTTYIAGDGLDLTGDTFSVEATIARLASPALSGTPTAPTAVQTTNSTQIATTAFVKAAVSALVGSAPGTLDALNEIATAIGNDPNFATTLATQMAGKQPLDATLTAIAGLSTAADKIAYFTGNDTAGLATLTAFARTLLAAADAAATRTAMGLGSLATQAAGAVNITGGSIDGVTFGANVVFDGGTF